MTPSVTFSVGLLEAMGVTLGHPHSSAILNATIALRELRVQANGKPIRVFYVFDPKRQAVLLIGGDKTGDKKFYDRMITRSQRIYADYLKEQEL